jgi:hypothetical protein
VIANIEMAREADLPAKDDVIAQPGAAGDANLRNEEAMFANAHVVSNLDEVVNFGAIANSRRAKRAAIHGDIRADLDVVTNDDISNLWDFAVDALVKHVAEAVRTNHGAGMNADAFADLSGGINGDVRKETGIFTNLRLRANGVATLQNGTSTDANSSLNDAMRPDVSREVNDGIGRNGGSWMDAGREHRLGKKDWQHAREGDAGVGHDDERLALGRKISGYENGRGGAGFGALKIGFVLGESKIACAGAISGSETGEQYLGVTPDFPGKLFGNFSGSKGHTMVAIRNWREYNLKGGYYNLKFGKRN